MNPSHEAQALKTKLLIPVRLKIIGLIAFSLAAGLASYLYVGGSLIIDDKTSYIYDYNLAQIKAASVSVEAQLEKVRELHRQIGKELGNAKKVREQGVISAAVQRMPASSGVEKTAIIKKSGPNAAFSVSSEEGAKDRPASRLLAELGWSPLEIPNDKDLVRTLPDGRLVVGTKLEVSGEGRYLLTALAVNRKSLEDGAADLHVQLLDETGRGHALKESAGEYARPMAAELDALGKHLTQGNFDMGVRDITLNDHQFMASYRRLPGSNLVVAGLIDKRVAFSGAKTLIARSVVMGISIFLVAIGLTLIFAKTMTARIKQIWHATQRVSAGEFTFRVDPGTGSRDELHDLATSFNAMSTRIEDLMKEVADKVRVEQELEKKRAIQAILDNLSEGFMTFDSNGVMQHGVSRAAREFFGADIPGKRLQSVLQLPENRNGEIKDWINLLFEEPLPFDETKGLGPRVFDGSPGKHIELDYRAVRSENQKMEKVIVVAKDKTTELALQRKAEAEAELVKFVIGIMRNRSAFVTYVVETRRNLANLGKELTKPFDNLDLKNVARLLHSIKGMSATYHVACAKELAHTLEDDLIRATNAGSDAVRSALPGLAKSASELNQVFENFLASQRHVIGSTEEVLEREKNIPVKKLRETLKALEGALGQSAIVQEFRDQYVLDRLDKAFARFEETVAQVAERQKKSVRLVIAPFDEALDLEPYEPLLGAMVHAFRNGVDHGIESPDERQRRGKPRQGTINVRFERTEASKMRWIIEDDGRGIDPKIITKIAVSRKIIDPARLTTMSTHEIVQLVFKPGFSSAAEVSDISGRGVGLDAIEHAAKELRGRAWIDSVPGQGTKLIVEIPEVPLDLSTRLPADSRKTKAA